MVIDAFAFCRSREHQSGHFSLTELTRLRAESVSRDGAVEGTVEWELIGGMHVSGYPLLQLTIHGTIDLICQRCLTPFSFKIDSVTKLILATDEAKADEIDASLEELDVAAETELETELIEVIVGSKAFDIVTLIEDEALLTIPLSPKHEVCPKDKSSAEKLDAFAKAKKVSPFAAIKDQINFGKASTAKIKH